MKLILFLAMCLADLVNVEVIQTSATISPREYIASTIRLPAWWDWSRQQSGRIFCSKARYQAVENINLTSSHNKSNRGKVHIQHSISQSDINKNTSKSCLACVIQETDVFSSPAFFKVQGLLDPPPNLTLADNANWFTVETVTGWVCQNTYLGWTQHS